MTRELPHITHQSNSVTTRKTAEAANSASVECSTDAVVDAVAHEQRPRERAGPRRVRRAPSRATSQPRYRWMKWRNRKFGDSALSTSTSMRGSAVAGGSASTCASSSGVGASAPPMPPHPVAAATATAAGDAQLRRRLGRAPAICSLRSSSASRPFHASGVMPFDLTRRRRRLAAARRCLRRRRPDPRAASGRGCSAPTARRACPLSTTWPLSTTTMRSASVSVDRRCAMRIVVRAAAIRRRVAWISSSIRASTDEVASSSRRMRRIRQQRARERDALPLPTREREPLFADDGVVAVREAEDELVRFGGARRRFDLLGRRIGSGERDVGADRVGEEERVLEHDADAAPQRLRA